MKNTTQVWLRSAGAIAVAGALMFGMTGCNGCGSNTPAPITNAANGPDPADANMASTDGSQPTQVMGQSQAYTPQQSSETYSSGQQAPAPIVNGNSGYNEAQSYNTQPNGYYDNTQQGTSQSYDYSAGDNYAQTDQAPPELPVYQQPPAPDDNDLWTPGYWGYANTGYYWVPGAWVSAPYVGALWTPGYWGWYGGHYRFNHGYWGRHIGYYGGINYGYGYIGTGYYGGYWNQDHFYYNRAVNRVSPRVTNVYERNVVVNNIHYGAEPNNRVSYNGGRGGVNYQPRPYEVAAMHEQHIGPLPAQQQFHRQAESNRANFFAENHGTPAQAAIAAPIRTEHVAAPPEVNRGGFGRGPAIAPNGGAPIAASNQRIEQGGAMQAAQRNAQLQQHNPAEQQRGMMEPQRNQLPGNNPALTQRGGFEQQHTQPLQQNQAAQRGMLEQQHTQQLQQQHAQPFQPQRNVSPQQPRAVQEPARPMPEPQHVAPQQQHMEQPRPQAAPQPQQHFEQRAAPQPQQHMEAPRPAPAPHVEAPRAAPAPHAEAPHAGPPAGGGGHPEGGGHH